MKLFKDSIKLVVVLLIMCGVAFPLIVTGASQLIFKDKANGSIVKVDGKEVGSMLVGQVYESKKFFQGRPSANSYNGEASGSSNLANSNDALKERVSKAIDEFLKDNPTVKKEEIPMDLIAESGSGLDPHISIEGANVQIDRVSKETKIDRVEIQEMIDKAAEERSLGVLGERRVNVLKLNLQIAKKLGMI